MINNDSETPNTKMLITIWASIGIFLVPFLIGASWLIYKYNGKILYRESLTVVSFDTHEKDSGYFKTTSEGTKLIFPEDILVKDLPENVKIHAIVLFSRDGSAMIYTDIPIEESGPDVVWRSNGKWYGILRDSSIKKNDFRMEKVYQTPNDCRCSPVTLMSIK
jgi:hypothetical protein